MSDGMVFVLGAGFTRAFVPKAPLLVGDYGVQTLRERFASFPHAKAILDNALAEYSDGYVDLERLMTRLSGMPYDTIDARRELALLETALRHSLVERIGEAKRNKVEWEQLEAFARVVHSSGASVVTFNYDDCVDEALWRATNIPNVVRQPDQYAWHPDGGYGFYCRPSIACVADSEMYMNETRSLVLKLHGSINWRTRLGEGTSRGPAGILHHEAWYSERPRYPGAADRIESHLEPDPFIVPPVLVKAELSVHPVLNLIWKLAHERLAAARTVVFIGYSLPATDLASRILFAETLANQTGRDVQIVNLADCDDDRKRVKDGYRSLFPNLPDANFDFSGASAWLARQPKPSA